MELEKLIINIRDNINTLDKYENYYFSICLQIFENNNSDLYSKYENIFLEKIKNMADYYGQDFEKNKNRIDEVKNNYFQYYNNIKNLYNKLFIICLKNFMNCFNEQKKCVANILDKYCTYSENKNEDDYKYMYAYAQNKVNYTLIMEECRARIKWCINEFDKDINELYFDEDNKIENINSNNFFSNIKKFFINTFTGKKKFNNYLDEYEKKLKKELDEKSFKKSVQIISTISGLNKQVSSVKIQIDDKFNELINENKK